MGLGQRDTRRVDQGVKVDLSALSDRRCGKPTLRLLFRAQTIERALTSAAQGHAANGGDQILVGRLELGDTLALEPTGLCSSFDRVRLEPPGTASAVSGNAALGPVCPGHSGVDSYSAHDSASSRATAPTRAASSSSLVWGMAM